MPIAMVVSGRASRLAFERRVDHPEETGAQTTMPRTVEAVIEPDGRVRLLEAVVVKQAHRAVVTILDEAAEAADVPAFLSEAALADDWNRPEEDAAWAHLQPAR